MAAYGNFRCGRFVSTAMGRTMTRIAAALLLCAWALMAAHPGGAAGAVLAGAVLAGLVAVAAARHPALARVLTAGRVRVGVLSLRRRTLRTAYLPVRDPAAPGRARPRAPSG